MHGLLKLAGIGALGAFVICDMCLAAPRPESAVHAAVVASDSKIYPIELKTVTLRVEGMTCGGCAISARSVLRRLDGVTKAEVSYQKKLAFVTYDTRRVTPEIMIEALKAKLGYTATLVEEEGS